MRDIVAIIAEIGDAGRRLAAIQAAEGAAGNLSIALGGPVDLAGRFPLQEPITLPESAPSLAAAVLVVTGSGCRLGAIEHDADALLGVVVVQPGGETAILHSSPRRAFRRLTGELNSHLALHERAFRAGANFQAVVHAQPPYLTFLSHIDRYLDEGFLNRRILRWQPELIAHFPDGIAIAPFDVPGSARLAQTTAERLGGRSLLIWARHGVIVRSALGMAPAVDLLEYAETGARYEQLNLASGEPADGLSVEEMLAICREHGVVQTVFADPSGDEGG
ncbi:MAG: class II aldolase/adducin family protein [Dehalococcoidia bacterium]